MKNAVVESPRAKTGCTAQVKMVLPAPVRRLILTSQANVSNVIFKRVRYAKPDYRVFLMCRGFLCAFDVKPGLTTVRNATQDCQNTAKTDSTAMVPI